MKYYQAIAESMIQGIPGEWSCAKFEAIFYSDGSSYEVEYVRTSDGVERSFCPAENGSSTFRSLRKAFKAEGKPLRGRALFELRPDGTFDVKLGYDNSDANGNTVYDEDAELKRLKERKRRLSK